MIYIPDVFKKDPDQETNKIIIIQNDQEILQEPEISKTTEQIAYPLFELIDFPKFKLIDCPRFEETPNVVDVLDMMGSLEKMRIEEQRLAELKKQLLAKQHDLESKLIKKIEMKNIAIANLMSEILTFRIVASNSDKQLRPIFTTSLSSHVFPIFYYF